MPIGKRIAASLDRSTKKLRAAERVIALSLEKRKKGRRKEEKSTRESKREGKENIGTVSP